MIYENCVAYPRISAPGSVQHVKTSDDSESQNGYPGKSNSFECFFITYVLSAWKGISIQLILILLKSNNFKISFWKDKRFLNYASCVSDFQK